MSLSIQSIHSKPYNLKKNNSNISFGMSLKTGRNIAYGGLETILALGTASEIASKLGCKSNLCIEGNWAHLMLGITALIACSYLLWDNNRKNPYLHR